MRMDIARDDAKYLAGFYDSPRHTMQVDFGHYVADLMTELKRGGRRASRRAA
jgi:hypothetical protein